MIKKRIKGILIILIYFFLVFSLFLWSHQYYGTEKVIEYWIIVLFPYVLGGAFITCIILGRLALKITKGLAVFDALFYSGFIFLLFLFLVIFENFTLEESFTVLAQVVAGFLIGAFWQLRKNKRKINQTKENDKLTDNE